MHGERGTLAAISSESLMNHVVNDGIHDAIMRRRVQYSTVEAAAVTTDGVSYQTMDRFGALCLHRPDPARRARHARIARRERADGGDGDQGEQ